MKMLLALACGWMLVGCGSVDFVPYQGAQQKWPTSSGAFVDSKSYALPVYHGRPPRPYRILGQIEVESAGEFTSASSAVGDAVTEAKKRGAAAVLLVSKSLERGEAKRGHATVIAIDWL